MEITMKGISKAFGSNEVLKGVDLTLKSGEIHALMGENGAGKSTLMNILTGIHKADSGTICVDGREISFKNALEAEKCGIAFIHQELNIWPNLSILENLFLMQNVTNSFGMLDFKKMRRLAEEKCSQMGITLPFDAEAGECSVGQQQMTEIMRNLMLDAKVVIMDEPTAVLTPQEIEGLFQTMRELRDSGASIILITHKLSEVMAITDEVTVLRDGKVTGHVRTLDTNEQDLARMMVGRGVLLKVEKEECCPGKKALSVEHLKCKNEEGVLVVDDVSFSLHYGEIVGIAGVQGNGQTELVDIISGMNTEYKGRILLGDQSVMEKTSPLQRRRMGLGHIPEDRQIAGSAPEASIEDNFAMTTYRKPDINHFGFISRKKIREQMDKCIDLFKIKIPGGKAKGSSLSGGNMQKLIFSREYNLDPSVLIAAQPTRGVDIGAMEFIHNKLVEMRDKKKAILLISNELSEIMSLSDRILVMYKGKITGELLAEDATEEKLGLLMAGVREEASI